MGFYWPVTVFARSHGLCDASTMGVEWSQDCVPSVYNYWTCRSDTSQVRPSSREH